jgi:succinoglycan biosynthesis protein ExoA
VRAELWPRVSVVIPCCNERRFIRSCLDSILNCDYPVGRLEVIVADGMSDDGTQDILRQYLDVHTEYASDYIRRCVEVLQETGADNVGGPARTKADSYVQKAICIAYHSHFSGGGARFHDVGYEGYVDTVTYGCWRRQRLLELGLFDEELVRNQDDELNLRIIRSGGRVWQSCSIKSWYKPRASLSALFRQYSQYGYWKVRVIQKHKLPASLRHLVPGGWVASLLVLVGLAPFHSAPAWLLAFDLCLYALANLVATTWACAAPSRWKFIPTLPVVFLVYHLGYGYGFLRGVVDFILLHRSGSNSFAKLTRAGDAGAAFSSTNTTPIGLATAGDSSTGRLLPSDE